MTTWNEFVEEHGTAPNGRIEQSLTPAKISRNFERQWRKSRTKRLCREQTPREYRLFLWPEAVTVKSDPTRPMSTWRTAWRKLTKQAGLAGLRFHNLRHHASRAFRLASNRTGE